MIDFVKAQREREQREHANNGNARLLCLQNLLNRQAVPGPLLSYARGVLDRSSLKFGYVSLTTRLAAR